VALYIESEGILKIMFTGEADKWARLRDLTEVMEKATQQEPSEGFTERVMARLPEGKATVRRFPFRQPVETRAFATRLTLGFRHPVMKTECAFCFLLSGFFYLVLGFVLMIGLRWPVGLHHPGWLSIQPLFGLLLAAWLTALGAVLYTDVSSSIRIARIGTVLYAVLVFLNGWLGVVRMPVPIELFFAVIFSVTGLGMAVFLGMAVDHCIPETISS
jgi:hypothetical protein